MFIQRITLSPALGKNRELRMLVEENIKQGQAQGRQASLTTPVMGDDMGSVVITVRHNDLAELEKTRAHNASDKAWQEYVGKVSAIATAKFELFEVLIPFPTK